MESDEQSTNKMKGGSTGGSDIDDDDSLNDYTSSNNSIKNLKYNTNKNSSSKNCINSTLYEIDNNNQESESNHKDVNFNIMDSNKNGIDSTLLDNSSHHHNAGLRLQTITLSDDDDFGELLLVAVEITLVEQNSIWNTKPETRKYGFLLRKWTHNGFFMSHPCFSSFEPNIYTP